MVRLDLTQNGIFKWTWTIQDSRQLEGSLDPKDIDRKTLQ